LASVGVLFIQYCRARTTVKERSFDLEEGFVAGVLDLDLSNTSGACQERHAAKVCVEKLAYFQ